MKHENNKHDINDVVHIEQSLGRTVVEVEPCPMKDELKI